MTVMPSTRLWHGGAPGLRVGDVLYPDPSRTAHLVDGCPTCEARRAGEQLATDNNDASLVYVTTDREYARIYAAGWPRGDLYRVEVDELPDVQSPDPVPSWGVRAARIAAVYDRCVSLTPAQIRRLLRRTGSARQPAEA